MRRLIAAGAAWLVSGAFAGTPQVTIGQTHTLALDTDGRVFAWGSDSVGQLGQGKRLSFETATVIAGLPPLKAISSRFQSVAALDRDGNVWTWGLYGLGDRSYGDPGRPSRVLNISDVARIESGFKGTAAIKTNGQVLGWGQIAGAYYQQPARFASVDGAVDIAVGGKELLVLRSDGSVWQLAGADVGQFAPGESPTATTPARVAGLPLMSRIYSFNGTADTNTRFAGIDRDGDVWVWGCWSVPGCAAGKSGAARKATGLTGRAVALSLDFFALYAAVEGGSVSEAGMAGLGLAAVFAPYSDFADARLLAGYDGTLYSLRAGGGVEGVGYNTAGELGIGTLGGRYSTRQTVVGLSGIVAIASGQFVGYALRSDGVLLGWGADYNGSISGQPRFGQSLPLRVTMPAGVTPSRIAAGARSSFALTASGELYAWGENFYGTLGLGNDTDQASPVKVPNLPAMRDVAGGLSFTALAGIDGTVWLNSTSQFTFSPLAGLAADIRRVFVPKLYDGVFRQEKDPVFALDANGVLYAFGYDTRGSGIFTQASGPNQFRAPAPVVGLALKVIDFSVAFDHALALLSDGTVWAWGRNGDGQLGDGTTTGRTQPAQVPGLSNVIAVSAGKCHSLALRSDGTVWSWGCNSHGELGDGTRTPRSSPLQVPQLDKIKLVTAGITTSFAVREGGLVFAWGNSSAEVVDGGSLGDGALVPRLRPVLVSRENGMGNVDREDWYLDLEPAAADNRPPFTSRTLAVDSQATPDYQSLRAAVIPRAADIGKVVGTYILARVAPEFLGYVGAIPAPGSAADRIVKRAKAGNDFILAQLTPNGWAVVTNQLTAYVTGTLEAQRNAIGYLNSVPLAPGSQFCIGYGSDENQMLAGETLAEVLRLPGASGDAGFPCALSGIYVSGPLVSKQGSAVEFNATVVGVKPSGSVQMNDTGVPLGPPLTLVSQNAAVSTASQVVTGLAAGKHSIGAHYDTDGTNATANVEFPLLHRVEARSTVTIGGPASSTAGDPVTFKVEVAGDNPSGKVQLRAGGAALGPAVELGPTFKADLVATGLASGMVHAISASYGGDANNSAGDSNTVEHQVAPAVIVSVELTASPNPANSANTVTLSATVNGAPPNGSIVFRDGNELLGSTPILSNPGTISIPGFAAGEHALTAEYFGDNGTKRVTSPTLAFSVELAQPTAVSTTALSISGSPATLGQSITLTATVSGNLAAPTGTVEFRDGGAAIPGCSGIPIVAGAASCVTNALGVGTHSIAAVYSGDAFYIGGASAARPAQVTAGAQLLTVSPPALDFGGQSVNTTSGTLAATFTNASGGSVTVTSVTPPAGFNVVTSNCGALAAQASCVVTLSFTPPRQGSSGGQVALAYAGGGPTAIPVSGIGEKDLVTHYYRSILRRAPDAGGKAFWQGEAVRMAGLGANVNETWFAMAMAFYNSAEYAAFGRGTAAFVTDLYNTFFNRAPDSDGLAYWRGLVDSGMPREIALVSFMFSPEFTGFTRAIFGSTAARAEVDAAGDYYRGILGRLGDSGGFTHWIQQFRAAQCQGAGAVATQADQISAQFLTSGEYLGRGRTNSQYVGDLYNAFLRRGADLAGVQFWIDQIASNARTREQVRVEFRNSPEFQSRVNAIVASGCVR